MAIFKLKVSAKGYRPGTYMKLLHVSNDGQQWRLQSIHHDDDPSVQSNPVAAYFRRAEVRELLELCISDALDTPADQRLIDLLKQRAEAPDLLMDLPPLTRQRVGLDLSLEEDDEEAEEENGDGPPSRGAQPVKKTVGLFEAHDQAKLSYEQALALVFRLRQGIEALTPEAGLEEGEFRKRLATLTEMHTSLLELLNGPSMIKGVTARRYCGGGIAGLAEELSPLLLEASYVIRAANEWLAQADEVFGIDPQLVEPCPLQAQAGLKIVRAWKKYKAYTAIWSGTKWSSGNLKDTLGGRTVDSPQELKAARRKLSQAVKKLKRNGKFDDVFTTDEIGTLEHLKKPIATLSAMNIARLKRQLRENAIAVAKMDPMEVNRDMVELALEDLAEEHAQAHAQWQLARQALEQSPLECEPLVGPPTPASLRRVRTEQLRLTCESVERRMKYLADIYDSAVVMNGMGLLPGEADLCAAIIDLPFTVKHATPNWYCIINDGSLDSLLEFQKKNPNWSSEFSTPGNIKNLGNHGFVFFRVDVGRDPIVTRYGGTQVIDDLSVIETDGWISLFDQLKPLSSTTMQRYYDHEGNLIRHASMKGANDWTHVYEYGKLNAKPHNQKKQATSFATTQVKAFGGDVWPAMRRECSFTDFVFYGPQIRLGIALSLIYELRMFIPCGYRAHVMKRFREVQEDDAARTKLLASLLSQTFRPEGKYPVALRFTRERVARATIDAPRGDGRWLEDATENPDVMPIVRAIQRRKYLVDAVAQAKKTAKFHRKQESDARESADANKEAEQRTKAEVREQEFRRLTEELEEAVKECEDLKGRHPEFFPPEDEPDDTRFRQGV